jgi:molybdate transport system permease protein
VRHPILTAGTGPCNLRARLRIEGGLPMDWLELGPEEWTAVRLSLRVATVATLASLPFGIAVAMALARGRFWGLSLLNGLVLLPLILPPVVTGYILLLLFGRKGPVGAFLADHFGIVFSFRWTGAALACGVMAFPLMVRAIRLSFEATDRGVFEAAAVLRAGPWDRFWSIALPLAWPGVLAGVVTAFAAGLGEFGAVITFASNVPGETQTLPLAIYSALQTPGGELLALRLAAMSMTAALVGLIAAELLQRWARRRLEA